MSSGCRTPRTGAPSSCGRPCAGKPRSTRRGAWPRRSSASGPSCSARTGWPSCAGCSRTCTTRSGRAPRVLPAERESPHRVAPQARGMTSLLHRPESRPLWADDGPPPPPPPPPTPPRHRRGRPPRLALLLVLASLLGGGTSVGALAATGSLGSDPPASGLDAQALYAATSAGVVDITVKGASGTGFEVDDHGHIVTAAHVVDGASSVTVKLADGTT